MDTELFSLHSEIERRHWWFVGRRQILARVVIDATPAGRRGLVLDIGCGTGANVASFSGFRERVGVDHSGDAIALASQSFSGARFIEGSVPEDVQDELASADLVMMNDVLEHVEDDHALFDSVWTGMKPGSNLLLTVPADPTLWSSHDVVFGHHRRYTAATFWELWSDRESRTRLFSYFNSRLFPIIKLARMGGVGSELGEDQSDFFSVPGFANTFLTKLFAGEADRLCRAIDSDPREPQHRLPYRRGVSLIALLEKP